MTARKPSSSTAAFAWRDDGVVFEADRAHVEKILEATRMADCQGEHRTSDERGAPRRGRTIGGGAVQSVQVGGGES